MLMQISIPASFEKEELKKIHPSLLALLAPGEIITPILWSRKNVLKIKDTNETKTLILWQLNPLPFGESVKELYLFGQQEEERFDLIFEIIKEEEENLLAKVEVEPYSICPGKMSIRELHNFPHLIRQEEKTFWR